MDPLVEPLDLTVADLAGEDDWFAPCVWILPSRTYGIVALGYRDGAIRGGWGKDIDDAVEVTAMPNPPILVPFTAAPETGADRLTAEQAAAELSRVGVLAAEVQGDSKPAVPNGVAVSQTAWRTWLLALVVAAVAAAAHGLRVMPLIAVLLIAVLLNDLAARPATRWAETTGMKALALALLIASLAAALVAMF